MIQLNQPLGSTTAPVLNRRQSDAHMADAHASKKCNSKEISGGMNPDTGEALTESPPDSARDRVFSTIDQIDNMIA